MDYLGRYCDILASGWRARAFEISILSFHYERLTASWKAFFVVPSRKSCRIEHAFADFPQESVWDKPVWSFDKIFQLCGRQYIFAGPRFWARIFFSLVPCDPQKTYPTDPCTPAPPSTLPHPATHQNAPSPN